jgi:hypothetical protein
MQTHVQAKVSDPVRKRVGKAAPKGGSATANTHPRGRKAQPALFQHPKHSGAARIALGRLLEKEGVPLGRGVTEGPPEYARQVNQGARWLA